MSFRLFFVSVAAAGVTLGSFALGACSSSKPADKPSDISGGSGTSTGSDGIDPACVGDAGCYACEPKKLVEFLNRCSGSQCAPFDNATRLPLYDGGALPPLP